MASVLTPAQLARGARPGVTLGNLQVVAAATTSTAVRGSAVPVAWLDEFGHVNGAGSTADSVDIYTAAMPALSLFTKDGLTIQTSTPLEKLGQFYASHTKAARVDPTTGQALAPSVFMFQLPSDELYLHTDQAPEVEMWPGGPTFPTGLVPKLTRQDIEDRKVWDPRGVEIEYEGQFAAAVNAYLLPDKITQAFGPYIGNWLTHQTVGKPIPGGTVDYLHVQRELLRLIATFRIQTMVIDQYNSIGTIQKLRARASNMGLDWRTCPRPIEGPPTDQSRFHSGCGLNVRLRLRCRLRLTVLASVGQKGRLTRVPSPKGLVH